MDEVRLFATRDPLMEAPAWFQAARAHLRRIFLDPAAPYPCYFAELGEQRATNYYTYLLPGSDRGQISDAEIGALSRALRAFLRLPRVRPAHRLSLLCLVEPPASPVSFAAPTRAPRCSATCRTATTQRCRSVASTRRCWRSYGVSCGPRGTAPAPPRSGS